MPPRRQPPVEYAALGHRHAAGITYRGQIDRVQRQRLLALQDLDSTGAPMAAWERRELELLERLQRGPELDTSELAELQQLMAETTLAQLGVVRSHSGRYETRGRSGRSALQQLDELRAGWLTPQQKIIDLWEQKIMFDMTPQQRELWKMRPA
jgi:hypothetical protein